MTRISRGRRWTVRSLAVVALFTASLFPVFVIEDARSRVGQEQELVSPGSPEARYGADHPAETIHIPAAIALEALVFFPLAGLIFRPGHSALGAQTGAIGTAMLLAAAVAGDPNNYGGQGLLVDPAFVALALPVMATAIAAAPWREGKGAPPIKGKFLLVFAALAAPALWYGFGQALIQRNTWPPLADPHHQAHWMIMAELAFAVPLATAAAALLGRGRRLSMTTIGVSSLAIATASMIGPDAASSLAIPWAVAAALWGMALLLAAALQSYRLT